MRAATSRRRLAAIGWQARAGTSANEASPPSRKMRSVVKASQWLGKASSAPVARPAREVRRDRNPRPRHHIPRLAARVADHAHELVAEDDPEGRGMPRRDLEYEDVGPAESARLDLDEHLVGKGDPGEVPVSEDQPPPHLRRRPPASGRGHSRPTGAALDAPSEPSRTPESRRICASRALSSSGNGCTGSRGGPTGCPTSSHPAFTEAT